jgi:hypothetical protein
MTENESAILHAFMSKGELLDSVLDCGRSQLIRVACISTNASIGIVSEKFDASF